MTQLSKERLELLAEGQEGFNLRTATPEESMEMARRLLAVEGQVPVAYMIGGHYLMHAQDPKVDNYASAVPLYAAPQPIAVPVVDLPSEFYSSEGVVVQLEKVMAAMAVCGVKYQRKGNACRAAMLQGDKS